MMLKYSILLFFCALTLGCGNRPVPATLETSNQTATTDDPFLVRLDKPAAPVEPVEVVPESEPVSEPVEDPFAAVLQEADEIAEMPEILPGVLPLPESVVVGEIAEMPPEMAVEPAGIPEPLDEELAEMSTVSEPAMIEDVEEDLEIEETPETELAQTPPSPEEVAEAEAVPPPFETAVADEEPAASPIVVAAPTLSSPTLIKPLVALAAFTRTADGPKVAVGSEKELFADWPKPKVLLVFTGFMNGYVEPCGCAGMDQMKGGLSRRYTFLQELENKGWPVVPIDAGNLNKGFGRQEELKYNIVVDEALRRMKYRAAGIGNRELQLPTDELIPYMVDVPGNPRLYTSANVAIIDFNPDYTKPFRVIEENGLRIGVTSVVGMSYLDEINNDEIMKADPVKKLREVLPQMTAAKCDRTVLIIHGTPAEIKRIQDAVAGEFDFVIPSDTPAEPPFRPNRIPDTKTLLVEVGEKGKFAVAIGLYDDPETPVRYQRVPLDSRFANSKAVLAMMEFYQDQLKETGFDGLGIKPIPDRRTAESGKYVGSKICADCHEPSFQVWRKSRHASAWKSLAETSVPPRTHDPECIACHVVGWHPEEFLPYENGFRGEKETPLLMDVGCESCHGPGEKHCEAELGGNTVLQEKLRKAVRLPLEGNAARKHCITCHDGDNSPDFDFDTYWPQIVHPEDGEE